MYAAIRLAALAALLAHAHVALAAAPIELEPTSDWTLDYGEEKCSLLRDFGPLDEGLGLRIDSYGSRESFYVTLVGDLVPRVRGPHQSMRFSLSPEPTRRIEAGALNGTMGEYRYVQFSLTFMPQELEEDTRRQRNAPSEEALAEAALPRPIDPQFEAAIVSISVDFQRGEPVLLKTGSLGAGLAALRTCIDDLQQSWGIDPVADRALSRRAYPRAESIRSVMQNFPAGAAMSGTNGFVPVRIMVAATGEAGECVVQVTNAPESFRKAVCENLAEDFEPALDANGHPVASFYKTSVYYIVS